VQGLDSKRRQRCSGIFPPKTPPNPRRQGQSPPRRHRCVRPGRLGAGLHPPFVGSYPFHQAHLRGAARNLRGMRPRPQRGPWSPFSYQRPAWPDTRCSTRRGSLWRAGWPLCLARAAKPWPPHCRQFAQGFALRPVENHRRGWSAAESLQKWPFSGSRRSSSRQTIIKSRRCWARVRYLKRRPVGAGAARDGRLS